MGRGAGGGGKVFIHPQVSYFIESVGTILAPEGERACWATDKHHKQTIKKHRCWKISLWEIKIVIQMFVNKTKLTLSKQGRRTNGCQNQRRNTANRFFIRTYKACPLVSSSLNGCVNRYRLTLSGVVVRGTKNKNNPTCWAHHTTDT